MIIFYFCFCHSSDLYPCPCCSLFFHLYYLCCNLYCLGLCCNFYHLFCLHHCNIDLHSAFLDLHSYCCIHMEVDTDYIPAGAVGIHCSKLEDDLENAEEFAA